MRKFFGFAVLLIVSTEPPAQAQPPQRAYVRFVHGSPDAPALDVYLDGVKHVENAAFKTISAFRALSVGKHTLRITGLNNSALIYEGQLDLKASTSYTISAINYQRDLKLKVFTMGASASVGTNIALVNIYHFSPNSPRLNLIALNKNNVGLIRNGIAYGEISRLQVPAFSLELGVVSFGKTQPLLTGRLKLNLTAGRSYSIFAVGILERSGDLGFTLLTTEDRLPTS